MIHTKIEEQWWNHKLLTVKTSDIKFLCITAVQSFTQDFLKLFCFCKRVLAYFSVITGRETGFFTYNLSSFLFYVRYFRYSYSIFYPGIFTFHLMKGDQDRAVVAVSRTEKFLRDCEMIATALITVVVVRWLPSAPYRLQVASRKVVTLIKCRAEQRIQ